ncbi:restriction endonuclease subunit S [Veillonella sp.]|jgi:type I restriction modification DNA specificity domain protein|uniref:restriction endonuclease subunit S n=1 Tax=Veillonella sp. TaxID=1926307 RepID=UPI00258AAE1B|nr:restriction endonuclease subunit S [Veillonella sp.]MDU4573213.1 restriction endonuclease subunit S [Veillonella sp.]
MSNWKTIRLGDIIKTNQNTYSPKENWKFVNYLDTGNITMNRVQEIQYFVTDKDKLPSRARRKVKTNDIIYSTVRPNQLHYGIIKEQPENFLVSTGFVVIEIDNEEVIPDYIYYVLSQQKVVEHLHAIAEQSVSAYPSLKPSDIENLNILIPDLETQKRIVSILSVIDKKITLNEDINNNLQDQSQAIFHKIFVNTSNPQREICKAEEYFDITIGKTPPRKEPHWFTTGDLGIKWASITDMGNCEIYISNCSENLTLEAIEKFKIKIIPSGTVILSFKLTVGRVAITHGEMTTNEAIAHFRTDNPFINEYLYCYLKNFNYQTMGSTSSIANAVNSKIIKAMPFVIPSDEELNHFYSVVHPIFEKVLNNQLEIGVLEKLKAALLPRLLSGTLEVSGVEP